ncbi:hypothetical protein D4R89_10425 [bacterium]|nr:MAG: hypothetical protein D4R89_10425 [bacterium]
MVLPDLSEIAVAANVFFLDAVRPLEIVIPQRAGHFSTLRLLASLRGQGAPENLQCALPGSNFQITQRSRGLKFNAVDIIPAGGEILPLDGENIPSEGRDESWAQQEPAPAKAG